jgi:hypothetical protein
LRNLLDVLRPRFCVFTGSTSVYPQNDGSAVTEESRTGGTPTGDVLLEAERLALERFEVCGWPLRTSPDVAVLRRPFPGQRVHAYLGEQRRFRGEVVDGAALRDEAREL